MDDDNKAGKVIPMKPAKPYRPKINDFRTGKVFEYLGSISNMYQRALEENRLAEIATKLGFKNFKGIWQQYQKQNLRSVEVEVGDNTSNFPDQEIELFVGPWHCDENGVSKPRDQFQLTVACSHPIMPVRRLVSIDSDNLKYTIAFRRSTNHGKAWSYVDVPAEDLLDPSAIVKVLAPRGVSISSGDRARALVDYMRDLTDWNYDRIPVTKSISRLGWNDGGFAPYNDGVTFDGAQTFAPAYKALVPSGSFEAWKEEAIRNRKYSTTARIVLAASFAAPLIEPLKILSFFVHLWSVESGTGKTVAQMLGASVWGDPSPGGALFPTFRSTSVGIELIAGFLHSIPVFLDELQLAKDSHGNINFNVYELASGSGKLRGNRQLGINYTPTWATTFITSGETPIVRETDGEGAINRVFEIECYSGQKVIEDGHRTSAVLKDNFGHAGKIFVEQLLKPGTIEKAKALYDQFYTECNNSDTTEKQAMAASAVLTADALATEWIFQDGNALKVNDIAEFLKTREAVSLLDRGYETICDWVGMNINKFRGPNGNTDFYGYFDESTNICYIIRSVFQRICSEKSLSEKGMLSHLRARGLLELGQKGFTKQHNFGQNVRAHSVCLRLLDPGKDEKEDFPTINDTSPLPFEEYEGTTSTTNSHSYI